VTLLQGNNIKIPEPCVLAMGKFECIHLGHQALINKMKDLAYKHSLATALVMFEPHPYKVLVDLEYKPLFTREERAYLTSRIDIDYVLEYPFDEAFAALSPKSFCRKIRDDLQAQIVVVGEGYRFGNKRTGTTSTIRQEGIQVYEIPHVGDINNNKNSTSTIRMLLSKNDLLKAKNLLGYPFFIMGTVTPGQQLGRTIGIPTINIYPTEDKFLPKDGVYATHTHIDGNIYKGVTNIGIRPTVDKIDAKRSVETFLFDYPGGDLYGKHCRTQVLAFIRPEQRFDSLNALQAQIKKDCIAAKKHLDIAIHL